MLSVRTGEGRPDENTGEIWSGRIENLARGWTLSALGKGVNSYRGRSLSAHDCPAFGEFGIGRSLPAALASSHFCHNFSASHFAGLPHPYLGADFARKKSRQWVITTVEILENRRDSHA